MINDDRNNDNISNVDKESNNSSNANENYCNKSNFISFITINIIDVIMQIFIRFRRLINVFPLVLQGRLWVSPAEPGSHSTRPEELDGSRAGHMNTVVVLREALAAGDVRLE